MLTFLYCFFISHPCGSAHIFGFKEESGSAALIEKHRDILVQYLALFAARHLRGRKIPLEGVHLRRRHDKIAAALVEKFGSETEIGTYDIIIMLGKEPLYAP